jgi:hypothetical protein
LDGSKKFKVRNIKSNFSEYYEKFENVYINGGMRYVFYGDKTGAWYDGNGVKIYTMYKI